MRSKLVLAIALVAAVAPRAAADPPDIDLAALGLDPAGSSFDDKLNIYGFADVTWRYLHWSHPNLIAGDQTTFAIGNLNIYLSKNLTPKARMLTEVRFLFAPNGSVNPDGSVVDTTTQDLGEYSRLIQWGGIVIERAYIEYDIHPLLTVRAGHWLTPYGIWNIDHGSPAIIGTMRPYIIGEQFFPEHQTGIDLFGSTRVGDYKVEYHATLSNGRGPAEAQVDQDNHPAVGGRLEVETPWGLKLGVSGYGGRSVEPIQGVATEMTELAYGTDAQWDDGGLHLQGELIGRHRTFLDGTTVREARPNDADGRELGGYFLAGYRFDRLWNAMPYAFYEYYHPLLDDFFDNLHGISAGINFRPAPSLVFKVQGTYARFLDGDAGLLAGERIRVLTTQAAWVF